MHSFTEPDTVYIDRNMEVVRNNVVQLPPAEEMLGLPANGKPASNIGRAIAAARRRRQRSRICVRSRSTQTCGNYCIRQLRYVLALFSRSRGRCCCLLWTLVLLRFEWNRNWCVYFKINKCNSNFHNQRVCFLIFSSETRFHCFPCAVPFS